MKTKSASAHPAATLPAGAPEPTEAEIQKEAYYLWIENGRPAGRDTEFWHAAQELLRHRATHAPMWTGVHFPPNAAAQRPLAPTQSR